MNARPVSLPFDGPKPSTNYWTPVRQIGFKFLFPMVVYPSAEFLQQLVVSHLPPAWTPSPTAPPRRLCRQFQDIRAET